MKPLVWKCIYGNDTYFRILQISLESLVRFGKYKGPLYLFSDRVPDATLHFVPAELRPNTWVLPFPRAPDLPIRYECAESLPPGHDVYLYADTDIVYDAAIAPVLAEIAGADPICFSSEAICYPELREPIAHLAGRTLRGAEWFGLELAVRDGGLAECKLPILNSGIIGARDLSALLDMCRRVTEAIRGADPQYVRKFSDQAVVNYVVMKQKGVSQLITRYVHFARAAPDESSVRRGVALRGMVHFLWSHEKKLPEMEAYLSTLNRILA